MPVTVQIGTCAACCGNGTKCPNPVTLYATVTPEHCSSVNFTMNSAGVNTWSGANPMGSCACPGLPLEFWDLTATCDNGNWSVGMGAPTGNVNLTPVTVNSASPVHLTATGTMTCEGPSGQYTFNISIEITE